MKKCLVSGLLMTALVLGTTGCRACRKRCSPARPCPPGCPPGLVVPGQPGGVPAPGPAMFPGAAPAPPPPGVVVPGPGAGPAPAPPPAPPFGAAPPMGAGPPPNGGMPPPPAPPPSSSGFGPPPSTSQRPDFRWEPAPGQIAPGQAPNGQPRLENPQPVAPDVKEDRKLYPPESTEPPMQKPDSKPLPPLPPKKDDKKDDKSGVPPLPVGIPQFTMVKEQVANGQRPALEEGLDWLKENGYKAVLFLHKPGDPDDADRKQAEKRGLKFLAIDVSPQTLSKKTVDEFAATVKEQGHLPLFVYDRDGDLTGGMWFLYFRLTEQIDDDAARVRISSLGFRENREDAHRQMWLAIQKLLADLSR